MNYKEKLVALEILKELTEKYVAKRYESTIEAQQLRQDMLETYGNVADVFEEIVGKQRVEVPLAGMRGGVSIYPNFFEAGFMSGRTFHTSQGQAELLKVIGRVKQLLKNEVAMPSQIIKAEKFNVFIKLFAKTYNIMDISEDRVKELAAAYHEGRESVTLSGNKYWLKEIISLQIFTYDSRGLTDPEVYLKGKGMLEYSLGDAYFPPKALERIGQNVTENYIVNEYGYLKTPDKMMNPNSLSKIKIFVSHKESDKKLAEALGAFLLDSLKIEREEIRISSVAGFQLSFKSPGKDQLREDLRASNVLLAILTEVSLTSTWVLMELGAAWALETPVIIPLLGVGLAENSLPGPLDRPAIKFANESSARERLRDAIREISEVTGCPEKGGGAAERALNQLVQVFKDYK